MRVPGLVPRDVAAALGVIVDLTNVADRAADGSLSAIPGVVGARAVHLVDPTGPTASYSVSSQSPLIDSCVVRFCSGAHRCSGTYTPREISRSFDPGVVSRESVRQTSSGHDRGGR